MNKTIQACIALAAFLALVVAPSAASASPELTSPTGTRAPVGTLLQGTNVEHAGTSKVVKLTTPVGTIECAEATLTGELTSNQEAHVAGNVTTTEFRGTPAAPTSPHCAGPGGLGTVTFTPNHATNPSHNGVSSLPWCITADAVADQFTVRGGKCSEAARNLTFTLDTTTIGACTYQKASVTGTYTTHPAAAVLTIQGQKFTKVTGSAFCPSEGSLDMAVTLETDPEGKAGEDVFVTPAQSSPELTAPTGTRAPVGTSIQATNVEHAGTSKVVKLTTPVGTIECAEATLTGELTSNQEAHVAGNVTTTEFRGTPAAPTSPHCAGPGGLGTITITPSHATNPSHNGVSSLPWCITADAVADQFTVRGGKCSEAARNLTFTLDTTTIGPCTYQKTSVTGTYTTHPAAALLTIQGQEFAKITGSAFCPGKGSLDMAFTLETDPEGKAGEDVYVTPAQSSPELTFPTGTRAPVGTLLQGTNVEHAETSKVVKMTTSVGTIECAEATLTGELTSNQEAHVAGNVTTTEFRGTPAAPTSPHCAGPGGLGTITITPSHATNPSHNGVSSLPWCITADAVADQFTVRGGKCSEAARNLTFTLDTTNIGACTYQKASVTGTYTTHPAAAVLTIQGQKFTKATGGGFCPSEGSLDMAFTLETDGESPQDVFVD